MPEPVAKAKANADAVCDDRAAECRCRESAGHVPPCVCPCGGAWSRDADGSFNVHEFPPFFTVRPDLAFDKEW